MLNVPVPSDEEWGPSRFNAGGLMKGAMTKERKRREGESEERALCLWAGSKVHAERWAGREMIWTEGWFKLPRESCRVAGRIQE